MPDFSYEAVDVTGTRQRGHETAADATMLARALETRGLYLLRAAAATRDAEVPRGNAFGARRHRLEFTRAMAALLPAGLPLARAADSAGALTAGRVQRAVRDMRERVVRGEPLADALEANGDVFSPLYVGIVRAGERRGDLAHAFAKLTVQLEREEQLRGRLLSALLYPMLLAVAGAAAIGVLLLVVLPQFSVLLADAGAALPRSTRLLLTTSRLLSAWWPLFAMLFAALLLWGAQQRRTEGGQRRLSRVLLALPLAGDLRREVLAARFARLLGTLLGGGAPLYLALGETAASLDDPLARDAAVAVRARIREGVTLHVAIESQPIFPPLLGQLVAVGEESSRLREFVLKAADILDERAERTAQRVATLAEPAMIVLFGAVVAVIAFSLLQAIYSVNAGAFVR